MTYFLLPVILNGQNALWTPVENQLLPKETAKYYHQFRLYKLNTKALAAKLVPTSPVYSKAKRVNISLPLIEETLIPIELQAAPILSERLRKKFPLIQSYRAITNQDEAMQGRICWTEKGLYGHFIHNGQTIIIEQTSIEEQEAIYLVYREADLKDTRYHPLICGNGSFKPRKNLSSVFKNVPNPNADLKTFRLAITATQSFTNVTGGTIASTLSSIVNSVNSLNVIYEKDLGVQFVLQDYNDQIIFTDDNPAPFTDIGDAFGLWEEHGALLDSLLGAENYDIGHIFAADCFGGVAGLAYLAGVCSANKASGVSCVFDNSLIEFRKTLYHEIGHQLGANHTWSNCGQSVNEDQRHAATAVEPGSGSTVMSYGGVCGPTYNIVPNAQDNLHGISILEIKQALASDTITCFQQIPTDNSPPVVSIRSDSFTIPILTPFELEAIATDGENTALSYSWEQFDTGTVSNIGFPQGSAPSFRSFPPTNNPIRIFPRATDIILNRASVSEVLPDTTRKLTFGVTVRDNHPTGGSTAFSKLEFFTTSEAGPFAVLAPNATNIEFEEGDSIEVKWKVANTDKAPVDCGAVDIYLSFNNGQEFNHLLATAIPNNGITKVVLPDTTTNRARVKVKCSDNIFFDMSNNRFKIVEKVVSNTQNIYKKRTSLYPNPAKDQLFLEFSEIVNNPILLSVTDALGRKVWQKKELPKNRILQLHTSNLTKGVYFLKGNIGEQVFIKRFIITNN